MGCGSSKSSSEAARCQPENKPPASSPATEDTNATSQPNTQSEAHTQPAAKNEAKRLSNDPTGITMGKNEQANTEQPKSSGSSPKYAAASDGAAAGSLNIQAHPPAEVAQSTNAAAGTVVAGRRGLPLFPRRISKDETGAGHVPRRRISRDETNNPNFKKADANAVPLDPAQLEREKRKKKRRTSQNAMLSKLALQFPLIRHAFLTVFCAYEKFMKLHPEVKTESDRKAAVQHRLLNAQGKGDEVLDLNPDDKPAKNVPWTHGDIEKDGTLTRTTTTTEPLTRTTTSADVQVETTGLIEAEATITPTRPDHLPIVRPPRMHRQASLLETTAVTVPVNMTSISSQRLNALGSLTPDQLGDCLKSLTGRIFTQKEVLSLFSSSDLDGSRSITFREFLIAVAMGYFLKDSGIVARRPQQPTSPINGEKNKRRTVSSKRRSTGRASQNTFNMIKTEVNGDKVTVVPNLALNSNAAAATTTTTAADANPVAAAAAGTDHGKKSPRTESPAAHPPPHPHPPSKLLNQGSDSQLKKQGSEVIVRTDTHTLQIPHAAGDSSSNDSGSENQNSHKVPPPMLRTNSKKDFRPPHAEMSPSARTRKMLAAQHGLGSSKNLLVTEASAVKHSPSRASTGMPHSILKKQGAAMNVPEDGTTHNSSSPVVAAPATGLAVPSLAVPAPVFSHAPPSPNSAMALSHFPPAMIDVARGFRVIEQAFRDMDEDGSNSVESEELKKALFSASPLQHDTALLEKRFKELDFDDSGSVTLPEFLYGVVSWVGVMDEEDIDNLTA